MPVSSPMLAPVVALVAWTMVMWLWMYLTRIPAISRAQMKLDPNAPRGEQMSQLPASVRWKADNYNHLMEQPTLFYAICLCLALIQWKPIATFYLLPTRAWELAIGSLGAFLIARPQVRTVARRLFWPSLVLLISLPFMAVGGRHPGLPALLICIATVVVILDGRLARNTSKPYGVSLVSETSPTRSISFIGPSSPS